MRSYNYAFVLLIANFIGTSTDAINQHVNRRVHSNADWNRFSYWPSYYNAAEVLHMRKRAAQSEDTKLSLEASNASKKESPGADVVKSDSATTKRPDLRVVNGTISKETNTTADQNTKLPPLDLTNPGVLKRGSIIFGGLALLAIAYFAFYRRRNSKNENSNTNNASDGPQFRYGMLQSDDRTDNMELSRMPLTMGTDDEEDDLEIFDLGQERKSFSYVNLKHSDETEIFNYRSGAEAESSRLDTAQGDGDRDNLLLDIDDKSSDVLISLSSSNAKSNIISL